VKVLFDHNLPRRLREHLPGHEIRTAREMKWEQLRNGALLSAASEARFEVFVTIDKQLEHQQNLRTLDELLGTKMRALYQRKKGRDLFDLAIALKKTSVDAERIVAAFSAYTDQQGHRVTRAQFEQTIAAKICSPQFVADLTPLLAEGFSWHIKEDAEAVSSRLIGLLPGDPWKGSS
jgi:predicted nucleotidyltransferase component of viral defense system